MANANVLAGSNRLKHSLKALQDHWRAVEPTWGDASRRHFEDRHLKPLDSATDAAVAALHKFADVLGRVRADLSDRSELS